MVVVAAVEEVYKNFSITTYICGLSSQGKIEIKAQNISGGHLYLSPYCVSQIDVVPWYKMLCFILLTFAIQRTHNLLMIHVYVQVCQNNGDQKGISFVIISYIFATPSIFFKI